MASTVSTCFYFLIINAFYTAMQFPRLVNVQYQWAEFAMHIQYEDSSIFASQIP